MRQLRCPVRNRLVKASPEEIVRSSFLTFLIDKGYPKSHLLVEGALQEMPHIEDAPESDRRADILVYTKEVRPLLLIECKAVPLNQKAVSQLIGYNHFVKAPFCALVNQDNIWPLDPLEEIPEYEELLRKSESTQSVY